METLKVDTLDVSLCKKYNSGKITLREMAMKLHENGWTNFLDENRAMEIINRYNNNLKIKDYGKY